MMPHRSIISPVSRQHHALGLSFNHLKLSRSILPHTSIYRIHTIHLRSVVHRVKMLLHCIHTLQLRSVVHQMEMLLHRIHTIHLHHIATHHIYTLLSQLVVYWVVLLLNHIHTLHLNLFAPEVVTTRMVGEYLSYNSSSFEDEKNEMSELTTMRKIWYFSILLFRCTSFDYYVVLTN
jgi:hypothetical protein